MNSESGTVFSRPIGSLLTVTSTRLQGVGVGVVSLGFAERPRRVNYRPSQTLSVVVSPFRRAG